MIFIHTLIFVTFRFQEREGESETVLEAQTVGLKIVKSSVVIMVKSIDWGQKQKLASIGWHISVQYFLWITRVSIVTGLVPTIVSVLQSPNKFWVLCLYNKCLTGYLAMSVPYDSKCLMYYFGFI